MIILITSMLIAFVTVLLSYNGISRFLKAIGVVGIDQQKKDKPVLPQSGGTIAAVGVFTGLLFFIALHTFITNDVELNLLLASLLTIQTITLIGFLDDLYVNKELRRDKSGELMLRKGLSQLQKTVMLLPAAVPLMAVKAGTTTMALPFIGVVNLGIIYPLVLVPIAVVCVASATNMLAGQNGLEASMGVIALTGLGFFALINNQLEASAVAFITAAALLAFLKFNWYPARILPGDATTYLVGGTIATVVIIGNMEKFGVIVFIPWIIEAFVKAKQKFKATSIGKLTKEGFLKPKNGRIESLTHAVMSIGNFKEWQEVLVLDAIEAACVVLAFGLWAVGVI